MRNDSAVAPVIAAMLVLAVIATFFAVWNATAIPSMKEQAEVTHLHEVEEGMLRFSSDIDTAASASSGTILSERIPLGGGDILYSPTKSGGILAVQADDPYMRIRIYNATSAGDPVENRTFYLANVTYRPSGNFWQDQGYVWSHGYVNVTKAQQSVPLEYNTMQEVNYRITEALFSTGSEPYPADPAQCSVIVIKGVNIVPKGAGTLSGNGIGKLALNSTLHSEKFSNVTGLNISIRSDENILTAFPRAIHDTVNVSIVNNLQSVCTNIRFDPALSTNRTITLTIDPEPNVTVIRQTSDISLSTQ